MGLGERIAAAEGVLGNHRIGIEQQAVPAAGLTQRLVIGYREAGIVGVGNEVHPGKAAADQLDRSVG